jgi:hypothetical protein
MLDTLESHFDEAYRPLQEGNLLAVPDNKRTVYFRVLKIDPQEYGFVNIQHTTIHCTTGPILRKGGSEEPVSGMGNICYRVGDGIESERLDGVFVKRATRDLHEGKALKRASLENLRCWISDIRVTLNSRFFRA